MRAVRLRRSVRPDARDGPRRPLFLRVGGAFWRARRWSLAAVLFLGAVLAFLQVNDQRPVRASEIDSTQEALFPTVIETPLVSGTELRERAELICRTAGQELWAYERALRQAALRHNKLTNVSVDRFARWMAAMIISERMGSSFWQAPMVDHLWNSLQVLGNEAGMNFSVGWARIRPQTVEDLQRGWITHQGEVVFHRVRVAVPNHATLSPQPSSWNLPLSMINDPEGSIELLGANLEMGTWVARRFGYEPTLSDLARWHNTGIGPWGWEQRPLNVQLWHKGTEYVWRVERVDEVLSFIGGIDGCAPPSVKEARQKAEPAWPVDTPRLFP